MARKVHSAAKHIDFVLFDILALVISFVAAYFIRIDRSDDAEYFEMYRDMGILILVIYLVIVAFNSTHSNILKRSALREAWEVGIKKASEFLRQAVEYDGDDPVCLDNMGQFHYRVLEDREEAKRWFEKALARKDNQIDTLYFLSRYDEEAGDKEAALDKLEKAAQGRFSPLNYCDLPTVEKEIARLKGES